MTGPRSTILVLEDEALVAMELEACLGDAGYRVLGPAATFDEALTLASRDVPDLLVADIRVAGFRDGIEAATVLRERLGVGAVFLSAHTDDSTVGRASRASPYAFLSKPFVGRELLVAVEQALRRVATERELAARERVLEEERRLSRSGAWTVDLKDRVFWPSPHLCELLGLPPAEAGLPEASAEAPVHPDDLELVRRRMEEAMARAGPVVCENRMLRADGEVLTVRTWAEALRGPDGAPRRLVGNTTVLEPPGAPSLAASRRAGPLASDVELALALEAAGTSTLMWDHWSGVVHASRPIGPLLGIPPEGSRASRDVLLATMVHAADRQQVGRILDSAAASRGPVDVTFRTLALPGRERCLQLRGRFDSIRGLRFVGTLVDITRRRELEEQRERLVAALEEAGKARERLVSFVAHDVRSPLASLRLAAVSLREGTQDLSERARIDGWIGLVETAARQIDALVSELRTGSPDRGPREGQEPTWAGLRRLIDGFAWKAEALGIGFAVDVPAEFRPMTMRVGALERILENLVVNALHATPPGGTVAISVRPSRGESVVEVRDTGRGIPAAQLAQVFAEGFRGSAAYDGSGLGLSIAKELVEKSGGRIAIDSAEGAGTRVTFTVRHLSDESTQAAPSGRE